MNYADAIAALEAAKLSGDIAAIIAAANAIAAASSPVKPVRKPRVAKSTAPDWFDAVAKGKARAKYSLEVDFTDGASTRVNAWQDPGKPIAIGRALRVAGEFYRARSRRMGGSFDCAVPDYARVELVDGDSFDPAECSALTVDMRAARIISAPVVTVDDKRARLVRIVANSRAILAARTLEGERHPSYQRALDIESARRFLAADMARLTALDATMSTESFDVPNCDAADRPDPVAEYVARLEVESVDVRAERVAAREAWDQAQADETDAADEAEPCEPAYPDVDDVDPVCSGASEDVGVPCGGDAVDDVPGYGGDAGVPVVAPDDRNAIAFDWSTEPDHHSPDRLRYVLRCDAFPMHHFSPLCRDDRIAVCSWMPSFKAGKRGRWEAAFWVGYDTIRVDGFTRAAAMGALERELDKRSIGLFGVDMIEFRGIAAPMRKPRAPRIAAAPEREVPAQPDPIMASACQPAQDMAQAGWHSGPVAAEPACPAVVAAPQAETPPCAAPASAMPVAGVQRPDMCSPRPIMAPPSRRAVDRALADAFASIRPKRALQQNPICATDSQRSRIPGVAAAPCGGRMVALGSRPAMVAHMLASVAAVPWRARA